MSRLQARKNAFVEGSHLELTVPQLVDTTWLTEFRREGPGPLIVEIGLGKDPHLIERAQRDPSSHCVGFEYSRKKADAFLAKALAIGLENVRVARADASRCLMTMFPESSIQQAYILFPDPWPKARHAKNRIVQPAFVRLLSTKMRLGGKLELRTDSPLYAQQMLEVMEAEPLFTNELGPGQLAHDPRDADDHVATLFETRFRENEVPIHYFYYERSGANESDQESP